MSVEAVLLDTCALLKAAENKKLLGERARSILLDGSADLFLSPATYWEIAIKIRIRKLELNVPYEEFIDEAIRIYDLTILDVSPKHTALLTTMDLHHKDPFDRLLIAQSISEGLAIVSSDATLDKYGITRLWETPAGEDGGDQ